MAPPLSCSWLLLLVFFPVWTAAWSWSTTTVPAATLATADRRRAGREKQQQQQQQQQQPCSPTLCGDVNVKFPFGILPDHATESNCGMMGFQVHCPNDTPFLGSYKTEYWFKVLDIYYGNGSLLVADVHKLQDLRRSDAANASRSCHSPRNNSSSKLGLPFSISPRNQNMVFYDCAEPPAQATRRSRGLVDTACGNRTLVGVARGPDVSGAYSLKGCNATVVPVFVTSGGEADPASYEELNQ